MCCRWNGCRGVAIPWKFPSLKILGLAPGYVGTCICTSFHRIYFFLMLFFSFDQAWHFSLISLTWTRWIFLQTFKPYRNCCFQCSQAPVWEYDWPLMKVLYDMIFSLKDLLNFQISLWLIWATSSKIFLLFRITSIKVSILDWWQVGLSIRDERDGLNTVILKLYFKWPYRGIG